MQQQCYQNGPKIENYVLEVSTMAKSSTMNYAHKLKHPFLHITLLLPKHVTPCCNVLMQVFNFSTGTNTYLTYESNILSFSFSTWFRIFIFGFLFVVSYCFLFGIALTNMLHIQFILWFMFDYHIVGRLWISVIPRKYKFTEKLSSSCQIKIDFAPDSFVAHAPDGEWAKVTPYCIRSFGMRGVSERSEDKRINMEERWMQEDERVIEARKKHTNWFVKDIECVGRKGVFPEAEHDPVIQIANLVTRQGCTNCQKAKQTKTKQNKTKQKIK
jgi:DNA polymerase delta subunit 1